MGIIHGGWMMTFLDSVLGFAVQTVLEAGETYVSLSTEVKFVRPLLAGGGQVRAIGELVSRSTRTATATAVADDRHGRSLGTGTPTYFINSRGQPRSRYLFRGGRSVTRRRPPAAPPPGLLWNTQGARAKAWRKD